LVSDKAILCDIDNTLAIRGSRDIYEFKKAGTDKVNKPVKKIIELFFNAGYKIVLISGREGKYSQETKQWLAGKKIPYNKAYFRKEGDYRNDEIVKKEIYEKYIKDHVHLLW